MLSNSCSLVDHDEVTDVAVGTRGSRPPNHDRFGTVTTVQTKKQDTSILRFLIPDAYTNPYFLIQTPSNINVIISNVQIGK